MRGGFWNPNARAGSCTDFKNVQKREDTMAVLWWLVRQDVMWVPHGPGFIVDLWHDFHKHLLGLLQSVCLVCTDVTLATLQFF